MTAVESMPEECGLRLERIADFGALVRPPQGDNQYELLVVERGATQIEIDGEVACLTAHDAILIAPSRSYHGVGGIAPVVWIVRFDAGEVDISLPLACTNVHRLATQRRAAVFAVLRFLAASAGDRSAARRLIRRLHFTAVVASVLESTDVRHFVPATVRANALVRDALSIIDRRYAECIGPAEIARELQRHPAYLTNLVREATGKSLGTWLIERRLGAARVLLRSTAHSVEDIAAAVGYVDVSHFARYFTRRYGAPPARWRRRQPS